MQKRKEGSDGSLRVKWLRKERREGRRRRGEEGEEKERTHLPTQRVLDH